MAKIKKDTNLRKSILQAAITGQLISNVEGETKTGKELLDKIIEERNAKLLAQWEEAKKKNPKAKKPAPIVASEIAEDEIPFEIPKSWCWCRLGELGLYRKGPFGSSLTKSMFVPRSEFSVKVYEQKNAIQKDFTLGDYYIPKEKFNSMQSFIVEPEDIIISCAGTIGEVYKLPKNAPIGIINQALMRVKLYNDELSAFWMLYFDYVLKKEASKQSSGTAIKNIPPFEILKAYPFPLPPLAVQNAIVAKLEEVLPLVDAYENAVLQKEELKTTLPDKVKKAILQEAIQGKLTKSWRKTTTIEESGKQLLDKIIEERNAKLLAQWEEAKKKNPKAKKPAPIATSEITEDEIPFEIPKSWCWCRLSEYLDIRDGTHDSPKFYDTGIPFVTSKNLNNGKLDFSVCKYITEEDHKKFSARSFVEDGDILFAMIGSIGNPVMVKKEFDFSFKNMALFKCYSKENTNMKYIYFYLCHIQKELKEIATGGVQSFIGLGTFREMIFPLPPLAEQEKIVEIIEQILPLCEKLGG
ncbi:restriction endonuclease subunit S [uncultured Campylobacter sp.]|uniref:restriction endonuclease subunit S n=1 Tax=uncultured Campylobacter sp. TaxID=218934 RepID=UPI0025E7415A|nr:restriction endonuclease subunit S [uncultured Campylobacter sp.]